jgi:hypothetical protein
MRKRNNQVKTAKKRKLTHKIGVRNFLWTLQNFAQSILRPHKIIINFIKLRYNLRLLRDARKTCNVSTIEACPPIHFVYGFKCSEEFPLYALFAIETTRRHHPGSPIFFYFVHEPYGRIWELAKESVRCVKLIDFNYYGIARFHHYAHKADVIRLLALRELGGIYLDIDTVCIRPFHSLLASDFVMGVQGSIVGSNGGLCNATMVSRPRSKFIRRWLRYYSGFKSKGRDRLWDFHSVKLPWLLASRYPAEIRVLPHDAFFFPLWNRVFEALFSPNSLKYLEIFENSYSVHLWNNMINDFLESLTPETLLSNKNWLYSNLVGEQLLKQLSETTQSASEQQNVVKAGEVVY